MTGYAGGPPVLPEIPYTDYTAGEQTVFAVMAALVHRLNTGQGQFIDVSQAQTASATVPEALLDFTVNGRTEPRMGNQDPDMAPHGCYPCRGDDRWIAIAVADGAQWHSICNTLGQPSWATEERFIDASSRLRHREELDRLVGGATADWDAHETDGTSPSRRSSGGRSLGRQRPAVRQAPDRAALLRGGVPSS